MNTTTMNTTADTTNNTSTDQIDAAERTSSRRRFFGLAGGAAAAVVAAAALADAQPASAADGDAIRVSNPTAASGGAAISTVVDYSLTTSLTNSNYFTVTDTAFGTSSPYPAAIGGYVAKNAVTGVIGQTDHDSGNGVVGIASAKAGTAGYGVWGQSNKGYGVVASSVSGIDLFCGGTGRLFMQQHVAVGPPTSGNYNLGEIIRDKSATVYVCIAATTNNTPAQWRVLGGGKSAGSLFLLDNPTRVYDSRLPNYGGQISSGGSRTVFVNAGIDINTGAITVADLVPAGATGITYNLTIANATGNGFLAVTPGDAATFAASTINWTPGSPTLANGTVVRIDALRSVKVFAGGGGSTDVIVDVTGYYI